MFKGITRTVWLVSLISLFNDIASEMLYPIIPIYLNNIGFSIFIIGILEGIIDGFTAFSKSYFGSLSDNVTNKNIFIQFGYGLSAVSKPLLVFISNPFWVLFMRSVDKIGKGLRTAPRDSVLIAESNQHNKGAIFGFHRAMDTLGACIGPAIAIFFLSSNSTKIEPVFYWAIIPGIIAVGISLFLNNKNKNISKIKSKIGFFSSIKYWKIAPSNYRITVLGFILFAVFNSSDMFIILLLKTKGFNVIQIIKIYLFYNIILALSAYSVGKFSDKIGYKKTYIVGLLLFCIAYFLIAYSTTIEMIHIAFFIYALFVACTDGISKAWIGSITSSAESGAAMGTLVALQSLCALFASMLTAGIWHFFSATSAIYFSSIGVFITVLYFFYITKKIN